MYLFNSLQNQQFTPPFVLQLGDIRRKYSCVLFKTALSDRLPPIQG